MNYYELLEISPSASVEVIKNAYKTLAKKYHPDTYKGSRTFAEEKMKMLNEAVSVLGDEVKRKDYDRINGIYHNFYQSDSDESYTDRESRININVDENGEPVFFSSNSDDSYMDAIDDFINGKKAKKKTKKPKDAKSSKSPFNADDISDISEMYKSNNKNNIENSMDGMIDYGDDDTDTDIESDNNRKNFKTFNSVPPRRTKYSKKAAEKTPKWYYVYLVSVIVMIIVMGFLIVQSVNIGNIKSWMSGLSGKSQDTVSNIADTEAYNIDDYTEPEIISENKIAETVPPTSPIIETTSGIPMEIFTTDTAQNPAETAAIYTTEPVKPTTSNEVIVPTRYPVITQKPTSPPPAKPPATNAPVTKAPTDTALDSNIPPEQTDQPVITDTTEDTTSDYLTETTDTDTTVNTDYTDTIPTDTIESATTAEETTTDPTFDITVPIDTTAADASDNIIVNEQG